MSKADSFFHCGHYQLTLAKPHVMAIINITPDSFSGDGLAHAPERAFEQAQSAIESGASILDIGGESSRPGAAQVSVNEELDRVIPVIEKLASLNVPISVDTVKPAVMQAAIEAGASIINDINALQETGALEVVASGNAGVCIMHMQGQPRTMQSAPQYNNVVSEVHDFLQQRINCLHQAGIDQKSIVLDMGFGFGKTLRHNLELFRALSFFHSMGYPLLVGVSRKSMLGEITGEAVHSRMVASVAAALLAVEKGAAIVRVHDVAETCHALKVWTAINGDANTEQFE